MKNIINYYQVNNALATSGQPTAADFAGIAAEGYQVVINLAMPTSDNALPNEGELVTKAGMTYIHLPVVWEAPKVDNVKIFFALMQAMGGKKVWVHCALNWRVSCFVYLYLKHVLNKPEEEATYPMRHIWQPDGVWQTLIEQVESETRDRF